MPRATVLTTVTRAALGLALVALVHSTSAAQAEGPSEDDIAAAKVEFEAGEEHFAAGRYAEAIGAYKRAHQRVPSPGFLYNIAQAYRLSGGCRDAADYYRRFLDSGPAEDLRVQADRHLRSLDCPEEPDPGPDPDPEASEPTVVDTAEPPAAPKPESHEPRRTDIDLTTAAPSASGGWKVPAGIAVAVVGLGATGAGIYFLRKSNMIDEHVANATPEQPISASHYRKGENANRNSWILMPTGIAAIAAGTGLYLWGRSESADHGSAVEVAATEGGARMSWSGRF